MHLSPEDKILLSVVKLHLSAEETIALNALLPEVKDWNLTVDLLIQHGSAPLMYSKLNKLSNSNCIAAELQSKLQQAYYKTLSRSMVLYQNFVEVLQALDKVNVHPIILKGAHLSETLYGDIALRQFSDLDILIPDDSGEKCLKVLRSMGYKAREANALSNFVANHSDFVHYSPMEKGEITVELHIKLHTRSNHYQLSIPDIWLRATYNIINKQKVKVLCTEDLLMHLCVHADKHFKVGHIQLKSFNDIINILEQLKSGFDWQKFEILCKQYKCENVVFKYFVLLAKYYQAYLPEELHNKYANCLSIETEQRFIEYLHGENFEPKGPQSAVPGHLNSLHNIKKRPDVFLFYLKEVLFPSKVFMIQKYNIPIKDANVEKQNLGQKKINKRYKVKIHWWFYYPYRWWIGIKGVFNFITKH